MYAVLGKYNYSSFEEEYKVRIKNIPIRFELHPYSSDADGKRTMVDKVLGKLLGKSFQFPTIEFKYIIPKLIQKEYSHDVLISIGAPHHIHWGCAKAKHLPNFPRKWIADCGDPFMNNGAAVNLKKFEKEEHAFCQLCDFITVPVEEAKNGYYNEYRSKIEVIPQGFDFDYPLEQNVVQNETIQFAYAGMFYNDIRNPRKILEYIQNLSVDFRFHVFTPFPQMLDSFQSAFGERLIVHKPIERTDLLERLKTMDFLLNIENLNSPNQIPSKLIDYAITNRPILSLDPENPETSIIDEFFSRNYSRRKVVENIQQYQISEVVRKFIDLASR